MVVVVFCEINWQIGTKDITPRPVCVAEQAFFRRLHSVMRFPLICTGVILNFQRFCAISFEENFETISRRKKTKPTFSMGSLWLSPVEE